MDAKKFLAEYAEEAEKYLDNFFAKEEKEAVRISQICSQMMKIYRDYMEGGKKARGALTYLGYQLTGRKDKDVGLPASIAIEIIHSFLLMHDDWIDKDLLRRGKPTVHVQYENIFKENMWKGEPRHWGMAMSTVLGDTGCFLGFQILNSLPCDPERIRSATAYLCDYLIKTAYGEVLDITYDYIKGISHRDILKVRELKTAYYTIVMPLAVGAVLGGAKKQVVEAIEGYGLPVGIAFQLRDDELGLFGEEERLGKSTLSDLLEGKKTLVILKTLEGLCGKDRQLLLRVWGKREAKKEEIVKVKKIIIDSGALEFSKKLSQELVQKGKKHVPQITDDRLFQDTLYSLADFMIERSS